ncbi:MAG: hypothetical protein ACXAD7_21430 [Candidatus Kariarchaeaceae archaeon]|jgi:hypothetical protein
MSSTPDRSAGKRLSEEDDAHAFLHVRVDADLKKDLVEYARGENTSLTAVVTALVEKMLYKQDEDEEQEEEDELLDLIVTSLMNLERRMEIRLATLQDTFNSLIGRLIDSQHTMQAMKPSQARKRRKGEVDEGDEDEEFDLSDVLSVNKEEEIYKRVKRYLEQQGKIVDMSAVIEQLEIDRTLKEYLDEQATQAPGLREALITDAIQEAAIELGYPMIDGI